VRESYFSLYSDAINPHSRLSTSFSTQLHPSKLNRSFKGIPTLHLPRPKRQTQPIVSMFSHSHPHFQCVGKYCGLQVRVPALYKPRLIDMFKFGLLEHKAIEDTLSTLHFPISEKALARELHIHLTSTHYTLHQHREENKNYLERRPVQLPEDTIMKVTGILCPTCYRIYSTCSALQLGQDLLYITPEFPLPQARTLSQPLP